MDIKIRDWTFTHWWVRPVVKVWFNIYHKSVSYSGTENVDWRKPIIFAPSHQNAFSDALCIILPTKYENDRFIYPLIRADAFGQHAAIDWMLTAFHMMPVYRPRDEVSLKKKNSTVFSDCHEILSKNRNLLIHPEGNCIPKKQVSRFKKGLARIALGAEAKHDFKLQTSVVPVGINYRQITEERKGIHIRFGEAIAVSEFKNMYREHSATAITNLTQKIEDGVRKVTVDISSNRNYALIETLVRLFKSYNFKLLDDDYTGLEVDFEKRLIGMISGHSDDEFYKALNSLYRQVETIVNEHKLNPDYPLSEERSVGRLIVEGVAYLALLPVFLYGWINNFIPWTVVHKLADRIGEKQFKSSARMVSSLLIFPLSYLLQAAAFWGFSSSPVWTLVYLFSLPFTGILSLNLWEKWKDWRQQVRLKRMSSDQKSRLTDLMGKILNKVKQDSSEPLSDTA